jgi:hypothetical protein
MHKVKQILIILLIAYCPIVLGQEQKEEEQKLGWQKEIIGNLNFTQNQFDNWTKGGENSWSWQLDINATFIDEQPKFNWKNGAKLSYGRTKVGKAESRKAADEIKGESVYTRKLGIFVNPYLAVTGQTQLTKGFEYTNTTKIKVSDFLDPAYFTQSLGIGYSSQKTIQSRLGFAVKETMTDKFADRYAGGEKTRVEYGAESVTDINAQLSNNIIYTAKMGLFSTLARWDEIDINWENLFSSQISQYIVVSFNFVLFYDQDVSKRRQIKQTLAAGLTYSFL